MITDKESLKAFLTSIDSPNKIYELFKELNYPKDKILDIYKRDIKDFDFAKYEREKVENIYPVFSYDKDLSIFFIEVKSVKNITNQFIRYVTRVFDDRYNRFLLILTIDYKNLVFVFPEREKVEAGKHKLKITKLFLKLDELYYSDIETIFNIALSGKESTYREIWFKWKGAFNVEKVTDSFFKDYKEAFLSIRKRLIKQEIEIRKAHEYTLQFLNRIMFIYFISKKRWLNNEPKFMKWFWNRYRQEVSKGNNKDNSFYQDWLKPIFYEVFNNQFSEKKELPDDVNKVLIMAPFLNGGLFKRNPFFDDLSINIDDSLFGEIFEFFEKYNFTIKEDMPLDIEVAVDPQMIGYVYESLANIAEKAYESEEDLRGDWGIFYTQRVEVDFMVRRAIVEYLARKLPEIPKEKIYELVFDEKGTNRFKENVEAYFEKEMFWTDLEEALDNLSAVDPACGSGAFVVGMLNVLVELYKVIYKYQKINMQDFRIKKRIVGKSLYGVDVMPWAIHAAELRLWLQLIVESDLTIKDLKQSPLLPNLNMNFRIGDSLVQEIGGINLHLRDSNVSDKMKKKLDVLKREKENFFNNDPRAKFNTKEELVVEEVKIFEGVIKERIALLERNIAQIKQNHFLKPTQTDLFGKRIKEPQEKLVQMEDEYKGGLEKLESDMSKLKDILPRISDPEKKPFVWDIDFAEVFGDKGGFDIVIGNPPYVRQEKIAPPNKLKDVITTEQKREYKEKLINSVKAHFPVVSKLDRKSDYYIYFYFSGLSILNKNGTFCFITSNSWLDVGYGKELQEFLLRYVPIYAIYDNSSKRSFAHADVNTIIALFGAPNIEETTFDGLRAQGAGKSTMLSSTARFVMFKKPFEEVINTKNLLDMERAKEIKKTFDYRVYPISHADLLEDGWEYPEEYDPAKDGRFRKGEYAGNKWGGKYLRAPDIFFTILEKGKGKLVRLGDVAKVRRGFTTGVNEFFYVEDITEKATNADLLRIENIGNFKSVEEVKKNGGLRIVRPSKWNGSDKDAKYFIIEEEFLKAVIKSPRECKSILVNIMDLKYKAFICHKSKNELNGTSALEYIEWGENQQTENGILWHKVPSVSGRKLWYDLGQREFWITLWPMIHNDRLAIFLNENKFVVDHNLFEIKMKDELYEPLTLFSTISVFFRELFGRSNLGEGALKTEGIDIRKIVIFDPKSTGFPYQKFESIVKNDMAKRDSKSIFEETGIDNNKPIREQEPKPLPDRKELDDIIFDAIGLTNDERKEVYWSVCELVKNRLDKAKSLEKNE